MGDLFILKLKKIFDRFQNEIKIKKANIEKIIIFINIIDNNDNGDYCLAVVNNNITGKKYQCTRKRKFGHFCGLHYSRKNNFSMISKDNKKICCYLNLKEMMYFNDNLEKTSFYRVVYNYEEFLVDSCNGNVYKELEDDELQQTDNLFDTSIPYRIK